MADEHQAQPTTLRWPADFAGKHARAAVRRDWNRPGYDVLTAAAAPVAIGSAGGEMTLLPPAGSPPAPEAVISALCEALTAAREFVAAQRQALIEAHSDSAGRLDAAGEAAVAEDGALLQWIDIVLTLARRAEAAQRAHRGPGGLLTDAERADCGLLSELDDAALGVRGTFTCRKPAIGPACATQCERCAADGVMVSDPDCCSACGDPECPGCDGVPNRDDDAPGVSASDQQVKAPADADGGERG